jgi:hypothetical protein
VASELDEDGLLIPRVRIDGDAPGVFELEQRVDPLLLPTDRAGRVGGFGSVSALGILRRAVFAGRGGWSLRDVSRRGRGDRWRGLG